MGGTGKHSRGCETVQESEGQSEHRQALLISLPVPPHLEGPTTPGASQSCTSVSSGHMGTSTKFLSPQVDRGRQTRGPSADCRLRDCSSLVVSYGCCSQGWMGQLPDAAHSRGSVNPVPSLPFISQLNLLLEQLKELGQFL